MESPEELIFVYGTLKRGQDNHHWLRGSPCHGRRRFIGARLHDLGPYPMAVPGEGILHGEIYPVGESDLKRLDRLEDAPVLYQRHHLPLDDGSRAWIYLGRPEQVRMRPLVPFGDWGTTPVFRRGPPVPDPFDGLRARRADGSSGLLHHLLPSALETLHNLVSVDVWLEGAPGIVFEALTPREP